MIRLLALLAFLLPGLASASPLPALHDVTGVASDDVLNIRAEPTATTPIIGTLAPNARGVEVIRLADNGRWGLVNAGEGAGWVSMRYLARQPGQNWGDIPHAIACFGTEPFWDVAIGTDGFAHFASPESTRDYEITALTPGRAHFGQFAVTAEVTGERLTAFVHYSECSDGMSDREYGLTAGVLIDGTEPPVLYAGCCTLEP